MTRAVIAFLAFAFPLALTGISCPAGAQSAAGAKAPPGQPAPAPQMTQAQALQVAKEFCRKIGQPVTTEGEATFPATLDEDAYWEPQWTVSFSGQASLNVADKTKVVTRYTHLAYFNQRNPSPTAQPISETEAIRRAQHVLKATGQTEELEFDSAQRYNPRTPPLPGQETWSVIWKRAFHGIPYLYQHGGVTLDAQTGEIEIVTLMYPSPPLTRAVVKVTRSKAVTAAEAHMVYDLGFQGTATLKRVDLEALRPDGGWSRFQDQSFQSRTARVGYNVQFIYTTPSLGGGFAELDTWVDAETGAVLGGEGWQRAGEDGTNENSPVAAPMLIASLKTVTMAYARRSDPTAKSVWEAVKAAAFTAQDQPQQIAALKKASAVTSAPVALPAAQLILVGKDNSLCVYGYDPATGALGAGTDWVTVPRGFRDWMQKRLAGTTRSSQ